MRDVNVLGKDAKLDESLALLRRKHVEAGTDASADRLISAGRVVQIKGVWTVLAQSSN